MVINSVKLKNFRTYKDKEFLLSPGTNVFYGNNAQGKTNILESIYVCALGKSFRTRKDAELVRFGNEFGGVEVDYRDNYRNKNINFLVSEKSKKQIKINGIKQKHDKKIIDTIAMGVSSDLPSLFGYGDIDKLFADVISGEEKNLTLEYYNRKTLYEKAIAIIEKRFAAK